MGSSPRGITLLELLVSLAILSTLLSLSMPSFRSVSQSVAADVSLRRLANAIQIGKSGAITNSTSVTLCRSTDGENCGGFWHDGVVVFTDNNRNREIDENDFVLRYITLPESAGSIRFRAFQNKQYLQLSPLGITHSQNGNFTYCPYSGAPEFSRQLIVNRTARIRYALDVNGDGIREDSRGRPLAC